MTHPTDPSSAPASLASTRQLLSALADGEATGQAPQHTSQLWRDDAGARQTWHTYHLIGDVMRSDELARPAAHDAAFLLRLRARLAAEPVVLAPAPVLQPMPTPATVRAPTPRWLVPVSAAAGLLLVVGAVLVNRQGASGDASGTGPAVAAGPAATAGGLQRVGSAAQMGGTVVEAAGVIRNPQLDSRLQEYLRAHQATRGGLVAAAPGGSLRRVDAVVTVGNGQ